jgi:hypothetical protein
MLNKHQIEDYINEFRANNKQLNVKNNAEFENINKQNPFFDKLNVLIFILRSLLDFVVLKFVLLSKKYQEKNIVYTSYRFTTTNNGITEDRIVKPLFSQNILFINSSLQTRINKINNQKVYNIGGVAKLLSFFVKNSSSTMRYFTAYQTVNKWILKNLKNKEIYMLFYYDLNNLSIIFSDFRKNLKLIEIQHGSIINYAPYSKPSPIKMIDSFYVKNPATIDFLKNKLCKNFDCDYHLLPYPKSNKFYQKGSHILYASTVEFNGIHPVFMKYLEKSKLNETTIHIRLHPREKDKKQFFTDQLLKIEANIIFDESNNWLETNTVSNIVVVSPWSSMIEDAADNGYKTIILEEFGKERFSYLIDEKNVVFTSDYDTFSETINVFLREENALKVENEFRK